MAWGSKEEQVLDIVRRHMDSMNKEKKNALAEYYSKVFFPGPENNWENVRWITRCGVTFVTMWDDQHLYNNIRLAMIKEMMGIGPKKYCIIYNAMPYFERNLLLLVYFLPHAKMSFFPTQGELGGPFTHSPWLEIGREIRGRTFNLKHPVLRCVYYTQQFVVFLRTGVFGPSYWM